MKLLITGSSGFIGSRLLSAACTALGAQNVITLSSKQISICPSIRYYEPDFNLNKDDVDSLNNVEILVHLGAFTPKSASQANSIHECNSNISFTERLLALPFKNLKKVIYISTIDVYEPAELTTESTSTIPVALYGWSKLYCERMSAVFAAMQNFPCQILRIGHVYGPGEEKYEKFIPKAIKAIIAGNKVELWGNGTEIRSFIYVDDVISAILQSINLAKSEDLINVVGGKPSSIREILDLLILISGKKVEIISRGLRGSKRNYAFDNSKLRRLLLPSEIDLRIGLQAEYDYMASLM